MTRSWIFVAVALSSVSALLFVTSVTAVATDNNEKIESSPTGPSFIRKYNEKRQENSSDVAVNIVEDSEQPGNGEENFKETRVAKNSSVDEFPKWIDEWVAPAEIRKYFPYYVAGYDDEGSPVYVLEGGRWRFSEALANGPGSRDNVKALFLKYLDQFFLLMQRDAIAKNGQGVGYILDMDKYSLANYGDTTAIELGLRMFQMLDRLYKSINYGFILNTSYLAENQLRLAKPFMGNILEKFEIFGNQKSKWLPILLRKIPKSQLPPWYGGHEDWRPLLIGGVPMTNLSSNATRR